jgi:AcrR family transcriptional regulator
MLESTPALLARTAERLFAVEGIQQVSMRQIADAAGQRNPAVVQYHFGTKLELMRAIVRLRIGPYDRRQLELCAALDAQGRTFDVRGLVEASLEPFAMLEPPDSWFVRFLAELMKDPDEFTEVLAGVEPELVTGSKLLETRLERALEHLPRPLFEIRLNLAINAGLSAIARSHEAGGGGGGGGALQVPIDVLLADLIEATTAFLEVPAPASAAALDDMRPSPRRTRDPSPGNR